MQWVTLLATTFALQFGLVSSSQVSTQQSLVPTVQMVEAKGATKPHPEEQQSPKVDSKTLHTALHTVSELSSDRQKTCLAQNIYHEVSNEPQSGWVAVAYVTLNRVHSKGFPKSMCSVVQEHRVKGHHGCQFSWVCHTKLHRINEPELYAKIKAFVDDFAEHQDRYPDITHGATYFHEKWVRTRDWDKTIVKTATVGRHYYYRDTNTQLASRPTSDHGSD